MAFLQWLEELSLSGGAGALAPAGLFAISVALFAYAIFHLSRSMTVQNALGVDLSRIRRSSLHPQFRIPLYGLSYVILYGVVFPLLAYVWFSILVIMLAFLYNNKGPQELFADSHGGGRRSYG